MHVGDTVMLPSDPRTHFGIVKFLPSSSKSELVELCYFDADLTFKVIQRIDIAAFKTVPDACPQGFCSVRPHQINGFLAIAGNTLLKTGDVGILKFKTDLKVTIVENPTLHVDFITVAWLDVKGAFQQANINPNLLLFPVQ